MISTGMDMPPFKVVAAALRRTTEALAGELRQPSPTAPDWNEFEWAVARSVSAMQGISVLLANQLRWEGPPGWQSFLEEQRAQSLLRDARIDALVGRLDSALRGARIGAVALKGAALRALDLYRPGERPMGDVDLLVSAKDLAGLGAQVPGLDYVEAYTTRRHVVYEPRDKSAPRGFGEHADNPLKIEVHTSVAEVLPVRSVDITDQLVPARVEPGLNRYRDLGALMLHLLLHAAGNMRAHALRQIQLHDIAMLAGRMEERDWQALLDGPGSDNTRWWSFPPLSLAARYYPGHIPSEALRAARASCPRTLRLATGHQALTDVSWSNLRIHAFPGIAWSRTPLDALRYMRTRALPDRRAISELGLVMQLQPQLGEVPWYGMSHGRRILRWLSSRPPRVQTISSLASALSNPGPPAE